MSCEEMAELAKIQFNCQVNLKDFLQEQLKKRKQRKGKVKFCGICAKVFYKPSDLKRHLLTHNKTKKTGSSKAVIPVKQENEQVAISKQADTSTPKPSVKEPADGNSTHKVSNRTSSTVVQIVQESSKGKLPKEEKRHFCDVCHKGFSRPFALRKHKPCPFSKKKPQTRKELSCKVCKRTFTQAKLLARHSKLHNQERNLKRKLQLSSKKVLKSSNNHECRVCHKKFLFNYQLLRHIKTHPSEKPFSCQVCLRKFNSRDSLLKHKYCVPVAKDEETLACVICGLIFPDKDQLKQHSVVHKDMKLYMCQVCRKCFKRPQTLQEHYLTHSDEKPFSCHLCGKGFKRSRELRSHKPCKTQNLQVKKENLKMLKPLQTSATKQNLVKIVPQRMLTAKQNLKKRKSVPQQVALEINKDLLALVEECSIAARKNSQALVPLPYSFPNAQTVDLTQNNSESFVCDVCGKVCSRVDVLREHYWTHTKQLPFSCKVCGRGFRRPGMLKKHVCTKAPAKVQYKCAKEQYKCKVCDKVFDRINSLNGHLAKHGGYKPHECPMCPQKFSSLELLNRHYQKHSKSPRYSCRVCLKTFVLFEDLKKHRPCNRKDEKTYACHLCKKCFPQRASLLEHLTIHTGEKPFSCSMCPRTYRREQELKRHKLVVHLGQKGYRCLICEMTFTQNSSLIQHYQLHSMAPYSCNICKATFTQIHDLKKHQPCQNNLDFEKKGKFIHSCALCNKKLSSFTSLKRHMVTHSEEKPFACQFCPKRCSRKDHMKEHLLIHSKQRPHNCEVCGMGFRRPRELRDHKPCTRAPLSLASKKRKGNRRRVIPDSKKRFSCATCGKSFVRHSHLKEHTMIHTGEKPLSCDICLQGFMRIGQLKKHKKTKHGLGPKSGFQSAGIEDERLDYSDAFNILEIKEEPIEMDSVEDAQEDMQQDPLNLLQIKYEEQGDGLSCTGFEFPELSDETNGVVVIENDNADSDPPHLSQECDVEVIDSYNNNSNPPELQQEIENSVVTEDGDPSFNYPDFHQEDNDHGCSDVPVIIEQQEIIIKDCSSLFNPNQKTQNDALCSGDPDNLQMIQEVDSDIDTSNQKTPECEQFSVDNSGNSSTIQTLQDNVTCNISEVSSLTVDKSQEYMKDLGISYQEQQEEHQPSLNLIDNVDDNVTPISDDVNLNTEHQICVFGQEDHQQNPQSVSDCESSSKIESSPDYVPHDNSTVKPTKLEQDEKYSCDTDLGTFAIHQEYNQNLDSELTDNINHHSISTMNQEFTIVHCDKSLIPTDTSHVQEDNICESSSITDLKLPHATQDSQNTLNNDCGNSFNFPEIECCAQSELLNKDCNVLVSVEEKVEENDLTANDNKEVFNIVLSSEDQNCSDFSSADNLNVQEFVDIGHTTLAADEIESNDDISGGVNIYLQVNQEDQECNNNYLSGSIEPEINHHFSNNNNSSEVSWEDNSKNYNNFHLHEQEENCDELKVNLTDIKEDNIIRSGDFDVNLNHGQDILNNMGSASLLDLHQNVGINDPSLPEVVEQHEVYIGELDSDNGFKLQQNVIVEQIISSDL